ncbi:helix-turn-helix domain-containing protein [Natronobeatus ordinarius]|uniref:helix-turn-helix domain-containing protein n=1 Tax=Natronobeatus ordinarius TaxID=2963433 RepID=UPI0020CE6400|nr:helix-turn-helix domain-containing protein [Natronobeatus ordinarius]
MEAEYVIVELAITGAGCPLVEATREHDVVVDEHVPALRADGTPMVHFDAEGDVEAMAASFEDHEAVSDLQVTGTSGVGTCRASLEGECLLAPLIDAGFKPHDVRIVDGVERLWGSVPGRDALADVINAAREHGSVRLERATTMSEAPTAGGMPRDSPDARLTKRQREALIAATEMGYFEVPRRTNATEVAKELGISKSAFLDRLKRAQASLFEALFSEGERQAAAARQSGAPSHAAPASDD